MSSRRITIMALLMKTFGVILLILGCWLLYTFLTGGVQLMITTALIGFMLSLLIIGGIILLLF